ncbi:hypothetical protein [Poseidonibacter sp.]|uniref:hypothetical protein n=1 Tax=Poseidonibacter sp. TaxID=2321188 RepID=UPI00359DECBB
MNLDLLIPFGILLALVIFLIYSRTKFEKDIVQLYEEKLKEWKKHSTSDEKKESSKELVGLVFKKDYKVSVELFDENVERTLKKGKFDINNFKG